MMKFKSCYCLVIVVAAAWPTQALARPVSYPDGWMIMQMNDHMENGLMVSYSPTARDALGWHSEFRQNSGAWIHNAIYNRLLQRWNSRESQGNIFLQTGFGGAAQGRRIAPAASVGLEADWETRRLYVAYENRFLTAGAIEKNFTHKVRFGVAPYRGHYETLHSWLMVQIEHHPDQGHAVVVTPFVRLFTKDVLGEIGISSNGRPMFNVTLQF